MKRKGSEGVDGVVRTPCKGRQWYGDWGIQRRSYSGVPENRESQNVEKTSTLRPVIGHAKNKGRRRNSRLGRCPRPQEEAALQPSYGASAVLQEKKEGERSA